MIAKPEWETEEDHYFFTDQKTGYKCYILRGHTGALNGYVRLPVNHPWHNKRYTNWLRPNYRKYVVSPESKIKVHGGLTFSGRPMCVAPTGEPIRYRLRGWWYGFDCSHATDLIPKFSNQFNHHAVYRNVEYVKNEVISLAWQLYSLNNK